MTAAAELSALARQIEQVPAAAITELAQWFLPTSERVGGRMLLNRRVVQLTSKVRNQRTTGNTTVATIIGTPAAAWSLKSYGRRGGYEVRPRFAEALRLGGRINAVFSHVTIHRAVSGDGRWDTLVAQADDQLLPVTDRLVDRSI